MAPIRIERDAFADNVPHTGHAQVPASKEKRNAMRTVLLAFTLIVAMGVTGVVATAAGVYVGETWLSCTRC